jgi:hypothetical protein
VYSIDQWFPKSALQTTSGPRDLLKWSANPHANQYFVLRGALKYFKWSANQKSLGTTGIDCGSRAKNNTSNLQWKIKKFKSFTNQYEFFSANWNTLLLSSFLTNNTALFFFNHEDYHAIEMKKVLKHIHNKNVFFYIDLCLQFRW